MCFLLLLLLLGAHVCACSPRFDYGAPLASDSPWPKFRRDLRQTGRSAIKPDKQGGKRWSFVTQKGIFSTPVIDAQGNVYIGSADRYFYAIAVDGSLRWKVLTGEIIDSSALLDDDGRVIFGSGDGKIRALDSRSGETLWTHEADPPEASRAIINWHEGNVAMLKNGTLLAGNDNFNLYAIDRKNGAGLWKVPLPDQIWSCAAVDDDTGSFFVGNNAILPLVGPHLGGFSAKGREIWSSSHSGSVAASPLITRSGNIVVGGFDGFVRSYSANDGLVQWQVATRDHLYASPAELSDGTLIQASTDGSVYAIAPESGELLWTYDTPDAIRSSPAIDADDNIYFGAGNGVLYVLDRLGKLSWAVALEPSERNDLNGSPALSFDGVVIAGESGVVHHVPYDYCRRKPQPNDCLEPQVRGDGAELLSLSPLGSRLDEPVALISANEPLGFYLHVSDVSRTRAALIDLSTLEVTTEPSVALDVEAGADASYITVSPRAAYLADASSLLRMTVRFDYALDPQRDGLRVFGGTKAGHLERTFELSLKPDELAPNPTTVTFDGQGRASGEAATWLFSRIAAPTPTILPSYNQIGFDSLNFLVSQVQWQGDRGVAWVSGGIFDAESGKTLPDPNTLSVFPLVIERAGSALTLRAAGGFAAEIMGAQIRFSRFVISARQKADQSIEGLAQLLAGADCSRLELYGPIMRIMGLCNAQTDLLTAFGATVLERVENRPVTSSPQVSWLVQPKRIVASVKGQGLVAATRAHAILVVDATTGDPLDLEYGLNTTKVIAADGMLEEVVLSPPTALPANSVLRVFLLEDGVAVARADVASI